MQSPAISVIIVSYNVRYFLDQCLHSLHKALEGIAAEIFVVDNHSADDSVELIQQKYPSVRLISNKTNVGFAKANNQALALATGAHVLLLNPDTLVREDTIRLCLDFFASHPHAGAVGVKMFDGTGQYLAESKRGLPTPWVAFCRLSGLSFLFPSSPVFNRYYLGYLSAEQEHRVDILCGAYMMVSRAALTAAGPLDEAFFMYGEDVDWSYRIQLAGFGVYYFPGTSIVHYKGESSRQESWPYLRHFYQAMSIFAAKHFTKQKWWYDLLLRSAIVIKALFGLGSTLMAKAGSLIIDVFFLSLGYYGLKEGWEKFYHHEQHFYPGYFDYIFIPALAITSGLVLSPAGLPSHVPESYRLIKRWVVLCIGVLMLYALLPLTARPSRALLLMSLGYTFIYGLLRLEISRRLERKSHTARLAIVGDQNEYDKVRDFLDSLRIGYAWLGHLDQSQPFTVQTLTRFCQAYQVDEVIFCSHNLSFTQITEAMAALGPRYRYRIASKESNHIISSSSSRRPGELYTYAIRFPLQDATLRLHKRIFDIGIAGLLWLALPVVIWVYPAKGQFLSNLWQVFTGNKTWVGYIRADQDLRSLPSLKPGILDCSLKYTFPDLPAALQQKINVIYAREYDVWIDMDIFIKGFFQLDQKS